MTDLPTLLHERADRAHLQPIDLGAVTAAVVGVILNLAVFLAEGIVLPAGQPDWFAIALAVAAFAVMQRWKLDIHWLVGGGAAAGMVWRLAIAV